jgi:hypothetical protein
MQFNGMFHSYRTLHTHHIPLVDELNDGLQAARLTIIFNMSLFLMFLTLV